MANNSNEKLNERVSKLEFKVEEMDKTLEDLKMLPTKQATLEVQYSHILEKLDGIEKTVSDINRRPAKFWDYVICVIISGVVGFIISKMIGI